MRFKIWFLFSLFFAFGFLSFLSVAQTDAVIQIGNKKISSVVFEKDYRRLLESDSIKSGNKQKFLEDYIDYQIKILAAEEAKISISPGFQDEYQSFRKELASPYLIDNEKVEVLVREAYQRSKYEKQIAQILVKLPLNPTAADTLPAYQKIDNIRKRLLAGDDFLVLADKISEDEISAHRGGLLGYVSILQTKYPIENAIYSLDKGQISGIIRTEIGYHIIKVLEIRPNQGKIRLAHILVSIPVNAATNLQVEAKNKIDQVYKYLIKGEDSFEIVCRNFSEDPYSKGRGGELRRWYSSSELSEELQDKLFGIQRLGDYTEPIRTNLGWQIFKLLDKKPLLSFEEMAEYLRQKVLTDPERSALIKSSFMKRVRQENRVLIYDSNIKIALERFAQDRVGDEPYLNLPLFFVDQKSFSIKDYYLFIISQQRKKIKSLGYLPTISEEFWLEEFIDLNTLQAEEQHLETKYPAFKDQMKEFYEGSLYSKMMEREIFEPSLDSVRQQNYFKLNELNFTLPSRIEAKLLSADTPKILSDALVLLKTAPYPINKRFPDFIFESHQSILLESSSKLLQELFILLAKNKDYVIEISGHRDSSELDSLTQGRVNRVTSYLTKKRIASTRIIEKLEGNLKLSSKIDKAKNARVSFKFFSQSMDDVVKRFNAIKPMSLIAEEGFFKRGESSILDSISWESGKINFEKGGRYYFVDVKNIEKQRLKSFNESRSSIIRALQTDLEQKWLLNLKQSYSIIRQEDQLIKIMQ